MRRKRPRSSRVLFVLSLTLAAGATMAVQARLARLEARAAGAGPERTVIVAGRDLARGTVLGPDMLDRTRIPDRFLPPGTSSSLEEVAGHVLSSDVAAGEPITLVRLTSRGGPVAALVPPSLRAVPVPAALPASAVRPGDRVDVLATYATGQPHTETVVTGAGIVSVLPSGSVQGGGVTLIILVGPESAERLAFARTFADLTVAIAPPVDASMENATGSGR